MIRVLCAGECMVELCHLDQVTLRLGYAGDTYNTAVYLRRVADELGLDVQVGYLTGVGADEYSAAMREAWAAEGIADRSVTVDGRQPGLYTVRVDGSGERRFTYWRNNSAARALFADENWPERIQADVLYLSGITLQLTTPQSRAALLDRIDHLRAAGTRIVLDTNYRPAGWASRELAAEAMDAVGRRADLVLATFDDEAALHGVPSPRDAVARIAALGCPEVVVKTGADGAWLSSGGPVSHVAAVDRVHVVDTTAAGDSFAGGYLAARLAGKPPPGAAALAAHVAATVIAHPGAIIPRSPLLPHHIQAADTQR